MLLSQISLLDSMHTLLSHNSKLRKEQTNNYTTCYHHRQTIIHKHQHQRYYSHENKTNMSRSILITFLVVFLVMVNTDQTQGLTAVLNRVVRNNSIWGKSRKTSKIRQANILSSVQVTMAKQASAEQQSSSSSIVPNLSSETESFFDADAYRQEMTDLVYQRNMQRLTSA